MGYLQGMKLSEEFEDLGVSRHLKFLTLNMRGMSEAGMRTLAGLSRLHKWDIILLQEAHHFYHRDESKVTEERRKDVKRLEACGYKGVLDSPSHRIGTRLTH